MADPDLAEIIEALWPHAAPLLQKALDRGGNFHSIEDVKARVLDGRALLWATRDSAIVTEIIDYPQARLLRYWLAGGKLDDVVKLEAEISDWARSEGCTVAVVDGRRGWEKALPDYRAAFVLLVKELV